MWVNDGVLDGGKMRVDSGVLGGLWRGLRLGMGTWLLGSYCAVDFTFTFESLPFFRSNTGFVNLYGSDSFSSDSFNSNANPKPVKTIGNLTTAISTLRFNHDAQILAVASKEKKDSMRMVSWLSLVVGFLFHSKLMSLLH